MAATVVSLPLPTSNDAAASSVNPAEARKRRREILASHRTAPVTPDTSSSAPVPNTTATEAATTSPPTTSTKKRRVSTTSSTTSTSSDPPVAAAVQVVSPSSPAKVTISKITGKPKKPQMKYDPDVPMTKEEAAAWRREQRRKRNRESAAASRQRQRDRIVELEAEVEEWKAKFEEAMKRIQSLEQGGQASTVATSSTSGGVGAFVPVLPSQEGIASSFHQGISSSVANSVPEETTSAVAAEEEPQVQQMELVDDDDEKGINIQSPEELVEEVFRDTTILISPSHSPRSVSPTSSTTLDFSQVQSTVKVIVSNVGSSSSVSPVREDHEGEEGESQPSKMISRQAVKINPGCETTSSLPLLPDEESLTSPDACGSSLLPVPSSTLKTNTKNQIAPIDSKLFPRPADVVVPVEDNAAPVPVTKMLTVAADNETEEFGEFLLDAVDWL